MKGVRKYSCQLSRKIVEKAQMKRKGVNIYRKAIAFGSKGVLNCGKLGTIGLNYGKKGDCLKSCSVSQCCFGKAALHNYENFRKSALPSRLMYFWSGVWNDFSPVASISLREAFSAGMPSVEVEIDGSPYLVDFLRMLQVDLRAGCQRSIAWIDKNGSCFFPKFVLEDNFDEEEEVPRKFEVEIEIRISPTEASNTKRCGVVGKKGSEIPEVSKTKKVCHPIDLEASSKTQKRGLTMNLEHMSNVPRPEPLSKVACMNDPKAFQVASNSSTKVLIPLNELDKRVQISSDEVGNGGLTMNLERMSNVPTPEPLTKVACMNDPKAFQVASKSSTKVLTPPNELDKRLQISSDEVGNGGLTMNFEHMSNVLTPEPLTKVACMNEPKAFQVACNSSTKALTPPNELDKRVQISSDEAGNGAPNCPSRPESKQCSNSVIAPVFEHLVDKLIKLREWDEEFVSVKTKFLDGLRKTELAPTISGIYRNSHTSALGQARLQAFYKQIEITRNSRGIANVRYAWHGTSDTGVSTIITHGFSHSRVLHNGPSYGVGVYLAPEDFSYLSVPFSRVDKNGEQHMVLCRVILGNVEEVPLGSRQFHPTCEKFDSGVDDLATPKYHIVWSTHMNTHILPEYVISFKAPHRFHGCWSGQKANPVPFDISKSLSNQCAQAADQHSVYEPVPRKECGGIDGLANMSFMKLLSIIGKHLPTASVNSLEHLYTEYKVGRIDKDIFIREVRTIAGDKLLLSIIRGLRGQAKVTQMPNLNLPMSSQEDTGGSTESFNLKNEFTRFTKQKDPVEIGRAEPAAQTSLASKRVKRQNTEDAQTSLASKRVKRQNTEDQFAVLMAKVKGLYD